MPRLPNRTLAIASDIEDMLSRWTGEESALKETIEPLRLAIGAERAAGYTFGMEHGSPSIDRVFHSRMLDFAGFPEAWRSSKNGWLAYDPTRPERSQRDRALHMRDLVRLKGRVAGLVGSSHWKKFGLADRDQLRVVVCDGPVAVAWIGGFRPGEFSAANRRVLQRLVPALKKRLALEARLREGDLARATISAALDRLGSPAFVVSRRGRIEHVNEAGRSALNADRASVMASVEEAIAAGGSGVTSLHMNGLGAHYLVTLAVPAAETHAATAATKWGLTRRQSAVLAELTSGASNQVIAARLELSVRTVEVHLTHIYERAGVETRAELLARVIEQSTSR